MSSVATKKLGQQLGTIAASWPTDPLRNIQLKKFLESLATHPRLTLQAVEAARALKNDDLKKKYPMPESLMRPASKPLHYERLAEGYDKSIQGIGRPWWKVFFNIW